MRRYIYNTHYEVGGETSEAILTQMRNTELGSDPAEDLDAWAGRLQTRVQSMDENFVPVDAEDFDAVVSALADNNILVPVIEE